MLFETYIFLLFSILLSIINQTLMNVGYILEIKKNHFKFYNWLGKYKYFIGFNIYEDRTNK